MVYLLGGPPKVGKSVISETITRKHGINVVSTDSLGAVLEEVLNPEIEPGLFAVNRFNERAEGDKIDSVLKNTTELIDYIIEESKAVWKGVRPFSLRERDEGRDVMIEGVAVLPELVKQLEGIHYWVVFVGNQGHQQKENIKISAKENEHDWMRHASDVYIDAFATFVGEMSRCIETDARKYGYTYIEMGKKPFHDAVADVVDSLLGIQSRTTGRTW